MKFPVVHVSSYVWDFRIRMTPTYVPVFGRALLQEISFRINPLCERSEFPESRLQLVFNLDEYAIEAEHSRYAIHRLREVLDERFEPTVGNVRTSAATLSSGIFRVPLKLPKCNFSDHAVGLIKQVAQAWEIDWHSPGLRVTRETLVKVRTDWVTFGGYLELKNSGEI